MPPHFFETAKLTTFAEKAVGGFVSGIDAQDKGSNGVGSKSRCDLAVNETAIGNNAQAIGPGAHNIQGAKKMRMAEGFAFKSTMMDASCGSGASRALSIGSGMLVLPGVLLVSW